MMQERCIYIVYIRLPSAWRVLLKIKGLCQSLSRLLFFLMQVDDPESIFLSRDNWCMWMRWNQLAKFFPLLPYLLPAQKERHQTQQSVDLGWPRWDETAVHRLRYKQSVATLYLPQRTRFWTPYYESSQYRASWPSRGWGGTVWEADSYGYLPIRCRCHICGCAKPSDGIEAWWRITV